MTRKRLYPLALPILVAIAGCRPAPSEYTKAQAPARLHVDSAVRQFGLAFARNSRRLAPGESLRLHHLVRTGVIRSSDRVTIAAAGGPHLADQREETISHELLQFGIVAEPSLLVGVAPDHALLIVGRYVVRLPDCPNWSQKPAADFTNEQTSNYGCSDATNLGLMVANPADLVSGEKLAPADGTPAVSAVDRYLTDKVTLPAAAAGAAALSAAAPGATPTGAPSAVSQ